MSSQSKYGNTQDTFARSDDPFKTPNESPSSTTTSVSSQSQHKSILKNRGNGNAAPVIPKNTRPISTQQHYSNPLIPSQYNVNNDSNNGNNGGQYNNNNYLPPTAAIAAAGLTRPASPFAMQNSSDGRENANSVSSTHRSSRNLAPTPDPNYNLTQTDMTLEGLAQRWHAYQAMWEKRYAEEPFYRRWTRSKWLLLFSALLLLAYSVCVLFVAVGYVMHMSIAGSALGIVSAIIGLVGVFLENRTWLSIYTILLWPVFGLYVSVGYIAFRRSHSQLRAHIKEDWIHNYTRDQRLIIQSNLKCCGFQSANWYAEYDLRCFPMTVLPGCQHKFSVHELRFLTKAYTISFSLVPVQIFVMIISLLCSNHVDGMLRSGRPGLKSFKEEKKH
ncbi:hypothetical protein BGZ80_005483 [Entomortierella chlamydospora]|uniref:Tetraspanin Tsp2 family n=1 Tax=Entomortierella chlamydospora TaxID=101097 RepID=A0A9P6T590_9FUNG|nr:hypothetical protein BGZ80_005483 [Entomortierella chlamydospora]